MLAKITAKNRLTLPKAVLEDFRGVRYFDVVAEEGRIVLTPVRIARADAVRGRLTDLGITEKDVKDAVQRARGKAKVARG